MVVLLFAAVLPVRAAIHYSCDFEDATERAQWQLNVGARGPQCESKWFIDEAGNFSQNGHFGLFISSDSINAVYTSNQAMYVVASRNLTLPVGTYNLDFDWRALTNGDATGIKVAWVAASTATNSNNSGSNPRWMQTAQIGTTLRGSRMWNTAHFTFNVTAADSQGKLVFLWDAAKDKPKPPSGCVDNITITDPATCNTPTNLTYNTQTATLSWASGATMFQVRDYSANDGSVLEYDSVTTKRLVMNLQSEGTHLFLVRALCGEGSWSAWVSTSTFVWIPGSRCIDYLDLGISGQHAGICYTGDFETFIKNNHQGQVGMVDNGPSAASSMHTLHTDMTEIDPNTTVGGGLLTVPDGEIASVRLGAYTGAGESARIEYKYTVQPGVSDLLDLKYAVVMESGGHGQNWATDGDQQPSFRLDVLDSRGQQLASTCTHKDFIVGFGDTQSWHWEGDPTRSGTIAWCDWQKVTVSLRPYVGQTLTIRLTSIRCSYDTHPAYAYFAIGCRDGGLEGIACGDFATDHFTAPDGFNYRWYKEDDPSRTTLSTEQTFNIDPHSADIYIVECHDLLDPGCYYTLVANPNPRFPEAQLTYDVKSSNCQHLVTFTNSSFIRMVDRETGATLEVQDPIYDIFYDFGDGSSEMHTGLSHTHAYSAEGGSFDVKLVAGMNNGMCEDTLTYTIDLPDLLHTGSADTLHFCTPDYYVIPNTNDTVRSDSVYSTYASNQYGCEAPYDHHLFFHAPSHDSTVVELCEGGYVDFEGKRYTETGRFEVDLKTVHGCDSTLALILTIIPRLEIDAPDTIDICADDPFIFIPYDVIKGRVSAVEIGLDEKAQERGFLPSYSFDPDSVIKIPTPENLHPGYYRLMLNMGTPDCPSDPTYVVLKVRYASSVIAQKVDLIALLNEDYNGGGYRWTSYQWYKNDLPMLGETTSYVVVSDMDQDSKFYCLLIEEDGTVMETCPIYYSQARTALDDVKDALVVTPTVLDPGQQMLVSKGGHAAVYDALGRLVASYEAPAAMPFTMPAPSQTGVYLVVLNHKESVRILVK